MTKVINSKADFQSYLKDFNSQNVPLYCQWYSEDVSMVIPTVSVEVSGRDPLKGFFGEARKTMNEYLYPDHVVLDDKGISIYATIYFVPKQDTEKANGFPAVKFGQAIRSEYIVFYIFNELRQIQKFWAVASGAPVVVDVPKDIRYPPIT
ncbi:hypothetical protein LTR84_005801 [Exophiala bonariae]|uniref:SnoaL-like domain-containing protein n=1 Tax=Exophiala bonariae TaxID=1690606 RepID=A0AAV9N3F1_9EURO|nr:hypothetical protein LTR84_005801 [Exophiala bonariae]